MIAESPLRRGVLYVGTEGGRVHVTKDDGATWADVSAGLPKKWVSRVMASQYAAGTAYAAFTGYREDDSRAYLYRSADFGATWTSIVNNLPDESINVVREDPRNPDVLYVGTDAGVYASLDRGATWVSLSATLPTTPVHDLVVHPRDDEIVIGTHGRGVFVLDARPIQQWRPPAGAAAGAPRLFPPHPALARIADEMEPAGTPGTAVLAFALAADGPATITIRGANGAIAKTLAVQGVRGLNVVTWNLLPDGFDGRGQAAGGARRVPRDARRGRGLSRSIPTSRSLRALDPVKLRRDVVMQGMKAIGPLVVVCTVLAGATPYARGRASAAADLARTASHQAGPLDACALVLKADVDTAFAPRVFASGEAGRGNVAGTARLAAVSGCTFTARGAFVRDTMTVSILARRAPDDTSAVTMSSAKAGAVQLKATPVDVPGVGDGAYWVDLGSSTRPNIQLNVLKGKRLWLIVGVTASALDTDAALAGLTKVAKAALGRL